MVKKRVTINDVADLAGVSIKTVSRVLNQEPNVRPKTAERVQEAARSLSYRPNLSARRLAANRSFVIGLLYDNPQSDYVTEFQYGSLSVCRQQGYHLLIHPCGAEAQDLVEEVLDLHRQVMVDGFIVLQPVSDQEGLIEALLAANICHVRISQRRLEGAPLVSVDDQLAATKMTEHLIQLGHRRIGFIIGRPDQSSSHDRLAGYRSALAAAGIAEDANLVEQGLYNFESGYAAARRLLVLNPPPTAIFASNDHMAMGVLTAAHEKGLEIPDQLSVAGFDDTPMARYAWPPLTTVRQPITQVARLSTELLVKRLRGDMTGERCHQLHSDLVRRASTAAPGS
jgi:LacI family transcriptional regulator